MKGVCFDTVITRRLPGVSGSVWPDANDAQENLHAGLERGLDDPSVIAMTRGLLTIAPQPDRYSLV